MAKSHLLNSGMPVIPRTVVATGLRIGYLTLALSVSLAHAQNASPLTLPDVVSKISSSPQWQQAELTLQEAQRALETAKAGTGLTLGVSGSATATPATADNAASFALAPSITATANVLPWSSAQDAVRSAQRNLTTAQAQRNATRSTLVLTAEQQYFAARQAQVDLQLAQRTVELRTQQLAAAEAQRALGNASQETVLTRTADLQTAQSNTSQTQLTLQQNIFALGTTLGVSLGDVTFSRTADTSNLTNAGNVDALISTALATRSEVVAAQQNLDAARDTLSSRKRDRALPDTSATVKAGQLGANGTTAGSSVSTSLNLKSGIASASVTPALGSSDSAFSMSVGLSFSYTFLDPVADANIASATTQVSSAQVALNLARQSVELDVRQKSTALGTGISALTAAQTRVTAAQTTLTTVNAQFTAGSVTKTDVLNAQVNLLTAQRDLESALANAQITSLQLQTALGQIPSLTPSGANP